jgi:hypothetical protein
VSGKASLVLSARIPFLVGGEHHVPVRTKRDTGVKEILVQT